jgi:Zn-dependent protease
MIFGCLQSITAIHTAGLHFVDYMIISFLILTGSFGCLFLHEYSHGLAARRMRLPVKEITVSLFGGRMVPDGEPLQAKDELLISVAGPAANICAGIIFYTAYLVFIQSDVAGTVFYFLSIFNGVLSVYNLMPVMPLDGGLIVRSAFWLFSRNWTWSTQRALRIGNGFAVLCIITGIVLIVLHPRIIGAVLFLLGLSLWQSDKLAYQQMLTAKILNIVDLKGYRKEVMRDAIR